MKKGLLVTIIIPTYNREKLLPDAIDSVINQTYKKWELVVVNDASTDNTGQVVDNYKRKLGNKLRYFSTKKNSGNCGATTRNIGIRNARGEYLLILDDDDILHPTILEKQIGFINKYLHILYVTTNRSFFPKNKKKLYKDYTADYYDSFLKGDWKKLSKGHYIWTKGNPFDEYFPAYHSGSLVHKSIYNKVGLFNERLKYSVDVEMRIKTGLLYDVGLIDEHLYYMRIGNNNYTLTNKDNTDGHIIINNTIKKFIKLNGLKKEPILNQKLSGCYFNKGYKLRKTNKLKSLCYYLVAMYCNYDSIQIKAIGKLFIPKYYKK